MTEAQFFTHAVWMRLFKSHSLNTAQLRSTAVSASVHIRTEHVSVGHGKAAAEPC